MPEKWEGHLTQTTALMLLLTDHTTLSLALVCPAALVKVGSVDHIRSSLFESLKSSVIKLVL